MKSTKAQVLLLLVASVASNPFYRVTMKYSFCPPLDHECEPLTLVSNSTFKFGDLGSGVYFIEDGNTRSISLSCSFHEPLHWIFTTADADPLKSFSSNVTIHSPYLLYHYHVNLGKATPGLIRCESYDNPDLAAEIYIAKRDGNARFHHVGTRINYFFPTLPSQGGHLIVPCSMESFDPSFNASLFRLHKLRPSDVQVRTLATIFSNCFFRELEAYVMKNHGRLLNSTEADFDPRIGFRLKIERDIDAVYVCSSGTENQFFAPIDPSSRIKDGVEILDNNAVGHSRGILVIVLEKNMETMDLEFLPCLTIYECELQLLTTEAGQNFRSSAKFIRSEPFRDPDATFPGRVIWDPPRSGVLRRAWFEPGQGYIFDLQYYFTGLDAKSYFVSDHLLRTAVLSLNLTKTTLPTVTELEVECTVATFIMFPDIEFFVEYSSGGNLVKIQETTNLRWELIDSSHEGSQRWKISLENNTSVFAVICLAPFRNTNKKAVAYKRILEPPITSSAGELPLLLQGGKRLETHLVVIVTLTRVVVGYL